jgi:AraC family transcriptional regulator
VTLQTLQTHGDEKYGGEDQPLRAAEWNSLRVEHRWIAPGTQNCVQPACTEIVHILSGHAKVRRRGNGALQEGLARPGTNWIVPAGTHETLLELDGPSECLVIFLPETLLERSALADYGIDPDAVQLAYAGGFSDPVFTQISASLARLLDGRAHAHDRVLADGMRTTLAAHLIGHYTVDRWQPPERLPTLDPRRLQRVLDFLDANLGGDISLADLAAEACLSPYHFSRLFRDATGLSPHRYMTDRRIESACAQLARTDTPLCAIALDNGFGSQANFTRSFRKATGTTPGQYRLLQRRQAAG